MHQSINTPSVVTALSEQELLDALADIGDLQNLTDDEKAVVSELERRGCSIH